MSVKKYRQNEVKVVVKTNNFLASNVWIKYSIINPQKRY
jgi:hypothetical protein